MSDARASVLHAEDVTVRFGGVAAVDHVSLTLHAGQIVGLIGPNGAGKSTLLNAVSGAVRLSGGDLLIDRRSIRGWSPHRRARAGIGRSFQTPRFVDELSVFDNIRVGLENSPRAGELRRGQRDACWAIIDAIGLRAYADHLPGQLSYGTRRLVDVARAAVTEPWLLLFDEPAAGLNRQETDGLGAVITGMVERTGTGVLLVEHDVDFVMDVAERVCVLAQGRVLADGPPAMVSRDPAVIAAYLGDSERA